MRGCWEARLSWLVGAVALTAVACGSNHSRPDGPSPDGASQDSVSAGTCGADVPPGQECNTLEKLGTAITAVCSTESPPSGTGGVIADGTYVLTAQTTYSANCTNPLPISETITIAGDCIQVVFGDLLSGTASGRLTTQGSSITSSPTCQHFDIDGTVTNMPFAMQTYTATSTTLTLFDVKTSGGTDVAVFTKR